MSCSSADASPIRGSFVRAQFDYIVLLSAPAAVMVERLTHGGTVPMGKHPEEVARSLHFNETVEPRLRSIAHVEVDPRTPVDEILAAILTLVRALRG